MQRLLYCCADVLLCCRPVGCEGFIHTPSLNSELCDQSSMLGQPGAELLQLVRICHRKFCMAMSSSLLHSTPACAAGLQQCTYGALVCHIAVPPVCKHHLQDIIKLTAKAADAADVLWATNHLLKQACMGLAGLVAVLLAGPPNMTANNLGLSEVRPDAPVCLVDRPASWPAARSRKSS